MRYSRDDAVERDLPKMPKIDKRGSAFCCFRIYRKKLKQTKIPQYDEDDDDAGEGTFSEDSPICSKPKAANNKTSQYEYGLGTYMLI